MDKTVSMSERRAQEQMIEDTFFILKLFHGIFIDESFFSKKWHHFFFFSFLYHFFVQQSPVNPAHNGPAFGAWHRYFMLSMESRMQSLLNDSTFTLPYWDWFGQKTCQVTSQNISFTIPY